MLHNNHDPSCCESIHSGREDILFNRKYPLGLLSTTVVKIYVNEIIVKRSHVYTKGITLSTATKANTLVFAESQIIIADFRG